MGLCCGDGISPGVIPRLRRVGFSQSSGVKSADGQLTARGSHFTAEHAYGGFYNSICLENPTLTSSANTWCIFTIICVFLSVSGEII